MFYYWEPKELELASGEKVPPLFSGRVKIRAPRHSERLGYLKELSKFGDIKSQDIENGGMEKISLMHDFAKKHIQEVELKRIEDGYEIKELEMFDYDSDLSNVLLQIASSVLEGTRLGKHLMKG